MGSNGIHVVLSALGDSGFCGYGASSIPSQEMHDSCDALSRYEAPFTNPLPLTQPLGDDGDGRVVESQSVPDF